MDIHHPFWKRNEMFQYTYCFGLGVMAMGHMKSITETQEAFREILRAMRFPEEKWQQIFFDLNNHFEEWIDRVFLLMRGKEEQYCFLLDLYRIRMHAVWSQEYCDHILEDFLQVFQLSRTERDFFERFAEAARKGNNAVAAELVKRFTEDGYHIRYDFLTWFYPAFFWEEEITGRTLKEGETLLLDHPVRIHGDIRVGKGSSLLIYGADIVMDGNIYVRGGRFQTNHAAIQVEKSEAPFWLTLEDTAVVTLTESRFDCRKMCGAICQSAGRLLAEDCRFLRTAGERAVRFSGKSMKIQNSYFHEASHGMVSVEGIARAELHACHFDSSAAEYGGAVYCDTIHDVLLEECTFRNCQAKYLGAAVYFKHQKLGQRIERCQCTDCRPQEEPYFHVMM